MKKIILIYIIGVLSLLSGCDARREIYPSNSVLVKVSLNWEELSKATKAEVEQPNGATVLFFPTDGGKSYQLLTNYTEAEIMLPIGEYNVLVFNETVNGHDYLQFENTDKYETFRAVWEETELSSAYSRGGDTRAVTQTDDLLLVDRLEGFEITADMSIDQETQSLSFTPTLVNGSMKVSIYIEGMDNVSQSGSLLYVDGMSRGYNLSTGEADGDEITHLMEISNREFDEGSYQNGIMWEEFYTFGDATTSTRAADGSNSVTFKIKLRNGEYHDDISYDITDDLESQSSSASLTTQISIDVEIGTSAEGDDPDDPNNTPLVLDDVPDTEEPDAGSGFDATINDWGDEEIVNVPL